MTLKTRVLSLVLAGSMMLSVTPVSAFAAEDHTGGGISALASQSSNSPYITDGAYGQTYDQSMLVAADDIKLTNCTFNKGVIVVGNNVTFENCTVDGSSLSVMSLIDDLRIANSNKSDAQLEQLAKSKFSKVTDCYYASLTLNGGTYNAPIAAMSAYSPLTIENGTFNGSVLAVDGNITINGGTFTSHVASALAGGQSQAKGALTVNNGVFAEKPVLNSGLLKTLSAPNTTFNGIADKVYVANSTGAPHIEMVYTPADASHKVLAWRLGMTVNGNELSGFTDNTSNQYIQGMLTAAAFTPNSDNTQITFNCISAFSADAKLAPVLDVNASDLVYTAPTKSTQASVKVGSSLPTHGNVGSVEIASTCYYEVKGGSVSGDALTEYPTVPGTYQVAVKLEAKGIVPDDVSSHRVEAGNVYHQIDPTNEITSENWRFELTPGVGENGKPTVTDPDNWTYDKANDVVATTANGKLDLKDEPALTSTVKTDTTGTIVSGTFTGKVENEGTIEGGTFSGEVTGSGTINGGVFLTKPESTANVAKSVTVTVTGGAAVNGQTKESDKADQSIPVTVVNEKSAQTLTLSAEIEGHEVFGWRSTVEGKQPELTGNATLTIETSDTQDLTVTPVVLMNKDDLTMIDGKVESKVDGVEVVSTKYYKLENGEPTGEGFDVVPEEPGTYVLCAALKKAETPSVESENGIALFAAPATSDLERVVVNNGVGYYAPELLTVGDPIPVSSPDDPVTPAEGGDGAGAAVVLGTVAAGGAAYLIGTQIWMETNLPNGVIPTNRQQLADMLWTAAGKPEPASAALYADISAEAVESQKAARWCVEEGLVKDHGESFDPADYTFRPQVIKAWNDLQARKAQ